MKFLPFLILIISFSALSQDLEETLKRALTVLESPTPTTSDFVVCDDPPVPNSLAEVNRTRTENQRGCGPLEPGKHREMTRDRYRSGNYVMRNLGNGRYAAVLNLNFTAGNGATPEMVESMKARTMNCLRSINPYLKNGNERMEIQVIGPNDRLDNNFPRPNANNIEVTPQPANFRGDAGNFGSNFTCRTIGHEILHLLGLCDEYHEGMKEVAATETRRGGVERNYVDWSCRPVTTGVSYMRNTWAFNQILPQSRRCDCGEECQQIMNGPEDIKRMFLSMNGDELMNSEMSLLDTPTVSINASRAPVERPAFCRSETGSLEAGVRPPVMKSFLYEGNSAGVHTFTSYRPRYTPPTTPGGSDGFTWFGYQRYICNCNGDTANYCNRLVQALAVKARETIPTVHCPFEITTPRDFQASVGPQTEASGLDNSVSPPQLVLRSPGNGQSLLSPQHFERIKAGDCRGGPASNYEFCEDYAYMGRNRIEGNGYNMTLPMNPEENQCADVPAQCFDDNFYLNGVGSPPPPERRGGRRTSRE